MSNLQGKLALVTGATRGIGAAIASALAKDGAFVIGTATSEAGKDKISQAFEEANLPGEGYVLDVTNKDSIEALHATIKEKHKEPLQVLVNNAGVTRDNLMLRMKDDEWDTVINTNLNAIYSVTKAFLRPMMKTKWGRIITVGSVSGLMGNPGQCNYSAAKAGVIAYSKSLAAEVASRGITVNVVAPGFVDTDMTSHFQGDQLESFQQQIPVGRFANPEEIAHAVLFLTDDKAGYITGETINVNGGLYMS